MEKSILHKVYIFLTLREQKHCIIKITSDFLSVQDDSIKVAPKHVQTKVQTFCFHDICGLSYIL